jgi:hypothetical protein
VARNTSLRRLGRRHRNAFIETLRRTANVTLAAKAAGVNRVTAYAWREEPEFRSEWDAAVEEAADALEAEAWRRAVDGIDEPIVREGVVVGTVKRYSDRLLETLLKGHKPARFREHQAATTVNVDARSVTANVLIAPPSPHELAETARVLLDALAADASVGDALALPASADAEVVACRGGAHVDGPSASRAPRTRVFDGPGGDRVGGDDVGHKANGRRA